MHRLICPSLNRRCGRRRPVFGLVFRTISHMGQTPHNARRITVSDITSSYRPTCPATYRDTLGIFIHRNA